MVFKSKSQKGLASVSLTQRYGYHQSKVTRLFFFPSHANFIPSQTFISSLSGRKKFTYPKSNK